MVEGQPLRYYYYYPRQEFTYFQQFDQYYPRNNMEEDLILPPSPHSVQSDSDNSISSVDVSSKPISVKKNMKKDENKEVQCCWRSCGIFFPTLDQLASHVSKVHASGGPGGLYYCGWEGCSRNNRGFNARYKMLVHVRTHTNEKPHQCYQCDKSFSRAENLKIHSRSHSGEKPYVCPVPGCNKAYSNSSDRFKHTRTHQVEKPYQCKVPGCPKRYTDPSSLRKHVKTYKHFITETEKEKKIETEIPRVPPVYSSEEESPKKHCECSHVCCNMSNCINKAAEIIRLGAIIKDNWMLDPFITEPKRLFTPYDLTPTSMEVDGPLDLSIHRKTL